MDAENGRRLRHQEAWELLPWYVNGTLDPSERLAVEDHLERCPLCRSELVASEELALAVRATADIPPAVAPRPLEVRDPAEPEAQDRLERLLARLDAPPSTPAAEATAPSGAGRTRPVAALRWVIALQAAAILALAVGLARELAGPPEPPPAAADFRTLAGPAPAAAAAPAETLAVRAVFSPAATESELRHLLLEVGAELAGGPSPAGVYTLHLAADDPYLLERLRRDPLVELAEPVVVRPPTAGGDR